MPTPTTAPATAPSASAPSSSARVVARRPTACAERGRRRLRSAGAFSRVVSSFVAKVVVVR